ncbi:PhoH family protein [Bartonella sp. HY329]|uniref:PhoH family protein n=1 Tax=unclassified Bartonella TaxID=2645622 RepID=UPI0021C735CB|nr:PhoH family protein [Bartonella sp. HY329]UXN10087.1 PhoH family protein [Bartonella sp. HY328]
MSEKSEIETSEAIVTSGASDLAHIVLTFDSNRESLAVFGHFDENLARIEQKLGVDIRAQGNEVTLRGEAIATAQARRALDHLYQLVKQGNNPNLSDTDGAIAIATAPEPQLELPTMEHSAKQRIAHISTRRKTIYARTPTQDAYMRAMDRAELVFGVGPAGTGKTYLAVAHAAQLLERGVVDRIILSRPAVEAGERLGFLPGDMKEKVDPYLRPLYDALYDMMPADKVERAITAGVIEIAPLAFMRGRTLAHSAIILDEAQNTTAMQMKMFLTRLGEGGRMIITGDPSQVDLPMGQKSGLVEALRILQGVDNIVTVRFTEKDVVRHPLVAAIVSAYDRDFRENKARQDGKLGEKVNASS